MWIGVLNGLMAYDPPSGLEVFDDVLIGIKNQLALIVGYQRGELAVHVHRHHQINASGLTGDHIVFTKSGRLVDDTGAVLGGYVICANDLERIGEIFEVIKNRRISQPHQFSTRVNR